MLVTKLGTGTVDAFDENFGGGASHLTKGLAHGGQGGILEGGTLNVVESDDGNIGGNLQAGLAQGTNCSHSRDVVEGEEGGKCLARRQQHFGRHVPQLRRWRIALQLRYQAGIDDQAELLGGALDVGPASLSVGAELLPFDECDLTMAEVEEVLQCYLSRTFVVEDDVGDTGDFVVSGDGDDGQREVEVPGGIDGDEAIHRSLLEHTWVLVDQIGTVAMAGDEVEVTLLQEIVFDAAHDGGGIAVTDFGDDDSDGETALGAQRAGEEVGTIFEFAGGGEDAVFGLLRDGVGDAGAVDDEGDGGGRKIEVLRQSFEAHRLSWSTSGSIAGRFRLEGGHGAQSRTRKWRGQEKNLGGASLGFEGRVDNSLDIGVKCVFHTDRRRITNAI